MRMVADMNHITEAVAAEVRAAVARANTPQSQIMDALGLSRVSVSKRLNGKQPFTVAELVIVAGIVGVEPKEFFRNTPDGTRAA